MKRGFETVYAVKILVRYPDYFNRSEMSPELEVIYSAVYSKAISNGAGLEYAHGIARLAINAEMKDAKGFDHG